MIIESCAAVSHDVASPAVTEYTVQTQNHYFFMIAAQTNGADDDGSYFPLCVQQGN